MLPRSLFCFLVFSLYLVPGFGQEDWPAVCGFNDSIPEQGDEPEGLINCNNLLPAFQNAHLDDLIPQGITRNLKIRTNVILMQRQGGAGNFSLSNPEHAQFLADIFEEANLRLTQLTNESCGCQSSPVHYPNIHMEFIPNFIEIEDEYYWNHRNDPYPNWWISYDKPYLMSIHNLATAHPNYQPGIDIIVSSDKIFYDLMVNEPETPLWELGYVPYYKNAQGNLVWYSSYPKFDLPHPAMWHAPDWFLEYDNGIRHLGGQWWLETKHFPNKAGVVLHEFFHYFDLKHVNCTGNIMSTGGYNAVYTSLTGCQVRTMYMSLMATNVRKYVVCEDVLEYQLTVDQDEEWKNNLRIYSDVVVKPGATLRVSCQIYMQPGARIIVERGGRLILSEDAIIANGEECSDDHFSKWRGITVEGNNAIPHNPAYANESYAITASDHGIVLLQEGSTLRDARTGIECLRYNETWNSGYWGAYINARGVNFLNNTRSIAFMKSNFPNRSLVDNCVFDGGKNGITNWWSHDVTVRNSVFQNLENRGIYSIDAGMNVLGNTFTGLDEGVGMDNLNFLTHQYYMKNNSFSLNGSGVRASAASSLYVLNNKFDTNAFGVSIMGQGMASIHNNLFLNNSLGVDLQSAGIQYKPVHCNIFSQNTFGINPTGDNRGLLYYLNQNHIIGNHYDGFIHADADGNPAFLQDQGTSANRIVNTFSIGHQRHLKTVNAETIPFYYFTKGQSDSDMTIPRCYQGDLLCLIGENNFSVNRLPQIVNYEFEFGKCNTIGPDFQTGEPPVAEIDYEVPAMPGETWGGVIQDWRYDQQVLQKIAQAVPAQGMGFDLGDPEAQQYLTAVAQEYVVVGDIPGLRDYLEQFGGYFLPLECQLAMQQGQFTEAAAMLQVIKTEPGLEPFALAQEAYLKWMNGNEDQITASDWTGLAYYASKDEPISGFPRSALSIMRGGVFPPSLPDESLAPRSAESSQAPDRPVLFPNPTDGMLHVNLQGLSARRMEVLNLLGAILMENSLGHEGLEKLEVDTRSLASGVYILRIVKSDGSHLNLPFVKK
jgi:hypothetical protein